MNKTNMPVMQAVPKHTELQTVAFRTDLKRGTTRSRLRFINLINSILAFYLYHCKPSFKESKEQTYFSSAFYALLKIFLKRHQKKCTVLKFENCSL